MMDDGGWAMRIGFANSPARGVMSGKVATQMLYLGLQPMGKIGFANSPARGVLSWQSRQGQSQSQNWWVPFCQLPGARWLCELAKAAKIKANRKNRFCQLPRARCVELAKPSPYHRKTCLSYCRIL